jgi:hypothetical protein
MRGKLVGAGFLAVSALALADQPRAEPLPIEIGACSETTIADIGYRLGEPDTGSAISYDNGGGAGLLRHHPGDPSFRGRRCGAALSGIVPEDCPPGDDRGKIYRATNLRTGESWEAPDSQHSCGGA